MDIVVTYLPFLRNVNVVFARSAGPLQWLLMLVVLMAVAMVAQWWQDKYVTDMFLSVRQYIDDGHVWELSTSEQNPLWWHNDETKSRCVESEYQPETAVVEEV